jgi:hypothetical protein
VLADVDALADLDASAELSNEATAEEPIVAPVGPEGVEGAGADFPRASPPLTLFELSRTCSQLPLLRPSPVSYSAHPTSGESPFLRVNCS